MRTDARASLPHFAEHLLPVWRALPPEVRGTFWVRRGAYETVARGHPHMGLVPWGAHPPKPGPLTLVASWQDLKALNGKPAIRMEHGAAQSYRGDPHDTRALEHPAYTGGRRNDNVILFLCPAQRTADEWQATYPKAKTAIIGSPKLDEFTKEVRPSESDSRRSFSEREHDRRSNSGLPVNGGAPSPPKLDSHAGKILLAFNWGSNLCPETRTARNHFAPVLGDLARAFPDRVVGTGHPRARSMIQGTYRDAGIPWVDSTGVDHFGEILRTTAVALVDNSSIGWELAALGVPVVWLNSPEYRRGVRHWLRFWDLAEFVCSSPTRLVDLTEHMLECSAGCRRASITSARSAYDGLLDGKAAERAALAILGVL